MVRIACPALSLPLLPFLALVGSFGLLGCEDAGGAGQAAAAPAAPSTAEVRAELDGRMIAYGQAAMAGDVEAILDLWTADARVREPGMNLDRAGIETFMRDAFGAGLEVTALDVRSEDVFVHGDVAYQFGEYDEIVRMPDADEAVTYENHYFARWERGEDGLWRLDRFVGGPRERGEM